MLRRAVVASVLYAASCHALTSLRFDQLGCPPEAIWGAGMIEGEYVVGKVADADYIKVTLRLTVTSGGDEWAMFGFDQLPMAKDMSGIRGVGCSTASPEVTTYKETTGQQAPAVDTAAPDVGVSVERIGAELVCVFLHPMGGASPETFGVEFSLAMAYGAGSTPNGLTKHVKSLREYHTITKCTVAPAEVPLLFQPCGQGGVLVDDNPAQHMFVGVKPGVVEGQLAFQFTMVMEITGGDRWGSIGYRAVGAGSQMENLEIMACDNVNRDRLYPFKPTTAATGAPKLSMTPNVFGGYMFDGRQVVCTFVRMVDSVLKFDTDIVIAHASGSGTATSMTQHTTARLLPSNIPGCPAAPTPVPPMMVVPTPAPVQATSAPLPPTQAPVPPTAVPATSAPTSVPLPPTAAPVPQTPAPVSPTQQPQTGTPPAMQTPAPASPMTAAPLSTPAPLPATAAPQSMTTAPVVPPTTVPVTEVPTVAPGQTPLTSTPGQTTPSPGQTAAPTPVTATPAAITTAPGASTAAPAAATTAPAVTTAMPATTTAPTPATAAPVAQTTSPVLTPAPVSTSVPTTAPVPATQAPTVTPPVTPAPTDVPSTDVPAVTPAPIPTDAPTASPQLPTAEVKCDTYTCQASYRYKQGKASIVCGVKASDCSDTVCCDPIPILCREHVCPQGFAPRAYVGSDECGNLVSGCNSGICCEVEVRCAGYLCKAGLQDKPYKAHIVCGGPDSCTDDKCCTNAPLVRCDAYTCPWGSVSVANSADIVCGASLFACEDKLCCSSGATTATTPAPTGPDGKPLGAGAAAEGSGEEGLDMMHIVLIVALLLLLCGVALILVYVAQRRRKRQQQLQAMNESCDDFLRNTPDTLTLDKSLDNMEHRPLPMGSPLIPRHDPLAPPAAPVLPQAQAYQTLHPLPLPQPQPQPQPLPLESLQLAALAAGVLPPAHSRRPSMVRSEPPRSMSRRNSISLPPQPVGDPLERSAGVARPSRRASTSSRYSAYSSLSAGETLEHIPDDVLVAPVGTRRTPITLAQL